jgi:hypothetical protein
MRAVTALTLVALPLAAGAENNSGIELPFPNVEPSSEVVGGTDAPLGKWPDAAAVLFGNQPGCTGTLIAPDVALTAAHCNDSSLSSILVGTNSLNRVADGEILPVVKRVSLASADIAVLVLGRESVFEPRAVASGWAQHDVVNGSSVAIVGYGATDRNASRYKAELQEVMSTITDFNCSVQPGCSSNELGAGGGGIDSCNGDSGGPLYLITDYGIFLAGVTSRAYANAQFPCGEGGIYGRPDMVLAQIEAAAGKPVRRGPEPTAERVVAIRGDAGETVIEANDPRSSQHRFEITTAPARGTARVREDGRVRVCVGKDAPPGELSDSLVVTVTDAANPARAVPVQIAIAVGENEPSDGDCNVDAFEAGEDGDGGGCCESGRGSLGGAVSLSLIVLVVLRRRRR